MKTIYVYAFGVWGTGGTLVYLSRLMTPTDIAAVAAIYGPLTETAEYAE